MKNILNFFLFGAIAFSSLSCAMEEPVFVDDSGEKGIVQVSAKFSEGPFVEDPAAVFTTDEINPKVEEILIPIPYFYPKNTDNAVTANDIRRMKMNLSVQEGCKVIPSIGLLDLNMDNNVEVIMPSGDRLYYIIKAQVYKLTECELESFSLTDEEGELYNCVVNNENHTVTAFALTNVLKQCAVNFTVSPHASISSPDISVPKDWKTGDKITVLAHDGVTKQEYDFSVSIAEKLDYGLRKGSEVNKWMKRYKDDYSEEIAYDNAKKIYPRMRLAVSGDYLLASTGQNVVVVINKQTGEKIKRVLFATSYLIHNIANDDAGNIILAAEGPHTSDIMMYKMTAESIRKGDFNLEEMFKTNSNKNIAGHVTGNYRIKGDITKDAVITALAGGAKPNYYLAWEIKGGKPAWVVGEYAKAVFGKTPNTGHIWRPLWGVVMPAGPTFADGMFFVAYGGIYDLFYSSEIKKNSEWTSVMKTGGTSAELINNLALTEFNGAKYLGYLHVATQVPEKCNPTLHLYDYSDMTKIKEGHVFSSAKPAGWAYIDRGFAGDVAFSASEDGYKLHLFWTDAGYDVIGCYEFDCIKK